MKIANITEARAHLSRLVARALHGDEVVIARAGRPLVRLVPVQADPAPRDLTRGIWVGRVRMTDDFDDVPYELRDACEGTDVDDLPA